LASLHDLSGEFIRGHVGRSAVGGWRLGSAKAFSENFREDLSAMKKILCVISLFFIFTAQAAVVEIDMVPTTWKLENYIGPPGPVAWFTSSNCTNGKVSFSSTATASDLNRFWATVITAKVSQKVMFVRYDNTTADCLIASFGILNGS